MVCRFDLLFYPGEVFTGDGDRLLANLKIAQKANEPSKAGPVPFVTPPSAHTLTNSEPGRIAPTDLGSAPTKALDNAVFEAAQLLRGRERNRRKSILLVSDGIKRAQIQSSHLRRNTQPAVECQHFRLWRGCRKEFVSIKIHIDAQLCD
jgi:hypothetical protein